MKAACIILNRNLPEPTTKLYKFFKKKKIDTFVVESGSDKKKIGKYPHWHVKTKNVMKKGLRFCNGFNFGLWQLYKSKSLNKYNIIFITTNDTIYHNNFNLNKIFDIFKKNPRLAILSPCGVDWGERQIIKNKSDIKFYWYIHNSTLILRKEFILELCNYEKNKYKNFLFDGSNFRGYFADIELVAKGYANNWASGITKKIMISENETYLKEFNTIIKTEDYKKNLNKYVIEGKAWMKRKYGFENKWQFQKLSKFWYDHFFEFNPEYKKYKIA